MDVGYIHTGGSLWREIGCAQEERVRDESYCKEGEGMDALTIDIGRGMLQC